MPQIVWRVDALLRAETLVFARGLSPPLGDTLHVLHGTVVRRRLLESHPAGTDLSRTSGASAHSRWEKFMHPEFAARYGRSPRRPQTGDAAVKAIRFRNS